MFWRACYLSCHSWKEQESCVQDMPLLWLCNRRLTWCCHCETCTPWLCSLGGTIHAVECPCRLRVMYGITISYMHRSIYKGTHVSDMYVMVCMQSRALIPRLCSMYGVFASISHPNYKISLHAYVCRYEVIPHIKTGTFDRAFAQMQGHLCT